ncbi:hypothetical protein [Echinimonas agarilytica]|uniref:Uncharacterized protein n=1 Tax=Echinimonas agarilytica TaxID=1215918 RepID=A0AA41WA53_9GAMM|nr:hypothetical protein [Echinimonas agarilytica]MCM2681058.1 hypothetical protein [Echinimonas agarilytica]
MLFGDRASGFSLSERRKGNTPLEQHYKTLKQFQIDRVSDLIEMGANLMFVRNSGRHPLAILKHGQQLLTVDQHGLIQSDPDLQVR